VSVRRLVRKAVLPFLVGIAVLAAAFSSVGDGQTAATNTARAAVSDDLHWG
jgi:hypothetical protein